MRAHVYVRRKHAILREIVNDSFGYISEVRISFNDFCPLFIDKFAVGNRDSSTVERYRYNLNVAKRAFGQLMLDEITQYKLKAFFSAWLVKDINKEKFRVVAQPRMIVERLSNNPLL